MTPKQVTSAYKQELALFMQEVSPAKDPKLFILFVHLYVEHLLERYISAKLKKLRSYLEKMAYRLKRSCFLLRQWEPCRINVLIAFEN